MLYKFFPIDELLVDHVKNNVPDSKVALLLSGGVDSISVGFTAQRLGKKIHAYSFRLDTHESYDFLKAKEISETLDWEFTGVVISTESIEADFHRLTRLGCSKKSSYECSYPFIHVYPKIQEKYVLSGWAADGYYGLSKTAMIHYKHTKEKFDEFRDKYFAPDKCANYIWLKKISDLGNKIFITPYLSTEVKNFFYSMDWEEVNKPFQKHHVRNAFPEFEKIGKVKKHLNLQIDSGVSKLFDTLIQNKNINLKNRTRIVDISRDWNMFWLHFSKIDNPEEYLRRYDYFK
jgi:asparagine synthetase B (glutamine-hydrolysing)